MAIFSKLRPSDASLAQFAAAYTTHRPLIQRCLTSGFVIYVLSWTYRGLSVRPSSSSGGGGDSGGKNGKGRKGGDGKAPRVAVSSTYFKMSGFAQGLLMVWLTVKGRRYILSASFYNSSDCHTRLAIQGSTPTN